MLKKTPDVRPYNANGCNGAVPGGYTRYFVDHGGESLHEEHYKYLGNSPKLNCDTAQDIKKWSTGFKLTNAWYANRAYHKTLTDEHIKYLIFKYGAVMSVVNASPNSFRNYKSGVWGSCSGGMYNHAALIVGESDFHD